MPTQNGDILIEMNDNKNYTARPRKTITDTIDRIFTNTSRANPPKEYLLLKLMNEKTLDPTWQGEAAAIFCFRLENRWGELNEGGKYEFEVEVSDRNTYILANFKKIYGDGMDDNTDFII
jgi:hypothetical protein